MKLLHVTLILALLTVRAPNGLAIEGTIDPRVGSDAIQFPWLFDSERIVDVGYYGPGMILIATEVYMGFRDSDRWDATVQIWTLNGVWVMSSAIGSRGPDAVAPYTPDSPAIAGVAYDGTHMWVAWNQVDGGLPSVISKYNFTLGQPLELVESVPSPDDTIQGLETWVHQPDRLFASTDSNRMFSFSKTDGAITQEESVPAGYNILGVTVRTDAESGQSRVWIAAQGQYGQVLMSLDHENNFSPLDSIHLPPPAPGGGFWSGLAYCPDPGMFVRIGPSIRQVYSIKS